MCGIVAVMAAYQNGFQQKEQKLFSDMLFIDTLRGFDSTGAFAVDNSGDVEIVKGALSGPDFIKTKEYENLSNSLFINGMFAVGHNRAATVGTITDANAHPFVINDKIVLVQNGTWWGDHRHIKNTEVDTEALAHLIHDHPDDIEQALQKINAAYALMWYNVDKKTLYAIRNSQRPLFMVDTKIGGVVIASEKSTIIWACDRNNIPLKDSPKELETGKLYSWRIDTGQYHSNVEEVDYIYKHQGADFNINYPPWARSRNYEDSSDIYYPSVANDANVVRKTFDNHIALGSFPDSEMTEEEADALVLRMNKEPANKEYYIEFLDYLNANYQTFSTAWYLVGSILRFSQEEPAPIAYQLKMDCDEIKVMDIVTKAGFYKAKLGSTRKVANTKTNKYVVISYISSMKPVELETINA